MIIPVDNFFRTSRSRAISATPIRSGAALQLERLLRSDPGRTLTVAFAHIVARPLSRSESDRSQSSTSSCRAAPDSKEGGSRHSAQWRRTAWSTRTLSWLILGELPSKKRFAFGLRAQNGIATSVHCLKRSSFAFGEHESIRHQCAGRALIETHTRGLCTLQMKSTCRKSDSCR